MAISSGACGGDLLFAESCLQRRLRVEIYLPFVEEEFVKESIDFAGAAGSLVTLLLWVYYSSLMFFSAPN